MTNDALIRAESAAIDRLESMTSRIVEAAIDRQMNPPQGKQSWDDVRIIETAEYLLNQVWHYVDSGNHDDDIDIKWTQWEGGKPND